MNKMTKSLVICNINESSTKDVQQVGGKGLSLIELSRMGVNVAPGFVLTTRVFDEFISANKLDSLFSKDVAQINVKDIKQLKTHFNSADFPESIKSDIVNMTKRLSLNNSKLIVRSSATIEDGGKHSFAGQFDTILEVSPDQLIPAIKAMYLSLLNPHALMYMQYRGIDHRMVKMGVIVQEFIKTDFAGVVFTVDPISKNNKHMIIEYISDLGEELMIGNKEPIAYIIDKGDFSLINKTIPKKEAEKQEMEPSVLLELSKITLQIEKRFGTGMDIEWGIKNRILYVFQARPITSSLIRRET